jgi:hypothetical protein
VYLTVCWMFLCPRYCCRAGVSWPSLASSRGGGTSREAGMPCRHTPPMRGGPPVGGLFGFKFDPSAGLARAGRKYDRLERHPTWIAAEFFTQSLRQGVDDSIRIDAAAGRSARASRWRADSPFSWDGSGKIKPTSTLCLRNAKGYPRRSKTSDRRIVVIGLPRGRPGRTGEHGTCWLPVGSFRCV